MKLKPGRYLFDTRMMMGKLAVDLAAGEQRYLRWDHGNECPSVDPMDYTAAITNDCEQRGAAIFEMLPEKGRTEIKKIKPVNKSDVKARNLIIIPPK
ncbi:MAG: hypothetical protein ABIV48_12120 [Pyrinomonadaceae bacterium]